MGFPRGSMKTNGWPQANIFIMVWCICQMSDTGGDNETFTLQDRQQRPQNNIKHSEIVAHKLLQQKSDLRMKMKQYTGQKFRTGTKQGDGFKVQVYLLALRGVSALKSDSIYTLMLLQGKSWSTLGPYFDFDISIRVF